MNVLTKTPKKVVIQIEVKKINENGFDVVWDEIRNEFPEDKFYLNNIDIDTENSAIFFELKQNIEKKA